ncbi:MAG: peptidoglycan-binding protein [Clostridia bacterium]|nr:peptidoglycan-binding protein [Clostridia bacterium]
MKKLRWMYMFLTVALLLGSALMCTAEGTEAAGPGRVGLSMLMDEASVPRTKTIRFDSNISEESVAERRTYDQQLVSSNGDVLHVEFKFAIRNVALGEGQWATVSEWLKTLVLESIQHVQADSESLVNVISNGYQARRMGAVPGETGMPAWASGDLLLEEIACTVPYYPDLSMDCNGDATRRLQEKLILMGFLEGSADGYYGANTQAAVRSLESYARLLEQDIIDVASPSTAMRSTAPEEAYRMTMELPVGAEEETAEGTGMTPATEVDGVADGMLQAYFFSDRFTICRSGLAAGDEGIDVSRIQTRLRGLGYTLNAPDGLYGTGTARAVGIFQHYSGLEPTGVADIDTQIKLFSDTAPRADHAMLNVGSAGDEVARLQRELRVLGFGTLSEDGSYGPSTMAAVETLQQYMSQLADAEGQSNGGRSGGLAIEVNGIADPLLLDAFYADSFPRIPGTLASGDQGPDVQRLQRRLGALEYYHSGVDGQYGPGTVQAVEEFQKRHGLAQTGTADPATMERLFDEKAKIALKPYVLKVSVDDQRVYAYAPDGEDRYTQLVRTMKCSTGRKSSPTPTGTFTHTGPGARWHYFTKFDCWAQYAFYIEGDILFHSVLYNRKDGKVTQSSVNHLGSRASHGCVRLSVEDARWIWENCPSNTKVVVY